MNDVAAKDNYRARIHWLVLVRPLTWMFSGLICYGMIQFTLGPTPQNLLLFLIGSSLLTVGMIRYLQATIYLHTVRLNLVGDKIVAHWGLFRRKTMEKHLSQVQSVTIDQCAFGKLFGAGTVEIHDHDRDCVPFRFIAKPQKLGDLTDVKGVKRTRPFAYPADAQAA